MDTLRGTFHPSPSRADHLLGDRHPGVRQQHAWGPPARQSLRRVALVRSALAPLLDAPFLSVVTSLWGTSSLFLTVAGAARAWAAVVNVSVVPSAAGLLAWKLPLILSESRRGRRPLLPCPAVPPTFAIVAGPVATSWVLNPLVIWSSSIHGEVDTFVALFLLLSLYSMVRESWFLAGAFFAVGVFAKAYPLLLLPALLAGVWFWEPHLRSVSLLRHRLRSIGPWYSSVRPSWRPPSFPSSTKPRESW